MSDQEADKQTERPSDGPPRKRSRKRSRKSAATTTTVEAQPAASTPAATTATVPAPVAAKAATITTTAPPSLASVNPHKPSYITRPAVAGGRAYTLSVAIPGSIVLNAQSPELQSRLAAHIARTCAIFNVDEIVVYDEGDLQQAVEPQEENAFDPHTFLARVLQYLETPQYLRKALFPMHRDLRLAGLMPPLDCPHHLRFEDVSDYREGVTVHTPHWGRRGAVYVNVGLRDPIEVDLPTSAKRVDVDTRVTVQMPTTSEYGAKGRLVSPREPVEQSGLYWGYSVRLAPSISSLLTSCPYSSEEGYDLVIGTSERGCSLTDLTDATAAGAPLSTPAGDIIEPLPKSFKHAIIVFGGLSGLEMAVEADQGIKLDRHTARNLFDAWINVVENQGSRTVRTEEAIMIALARLKAPLERQY